MIAALSPAGFNYDETVGTLRFAQSVSSIKTKSSANVDEEADSNEKMKQEIEELKKMIKSRRQTGGGDDSEDSEDGLGDMEAMLKNKENEMTDLDDDVTALKKAREEAV